MKKTLAIGLCGLVLLGAGCGGAATEVALERAAQGNADVEVDGNKVSVTTNEGTVEVGGNKLPDNWPNDVPVYPGATITFSGASNQPGNVGTSVILDVAGDLAPVVEYYKKELASQGWTITGSYAIGGATTIGAGKDTRMLALSIVASGGKTSVTIGIGAK